VRQVKSSDVRELTLHGERVVYRQTGSGPVLMLIHGITSDSLTWRRVMPRLARDFTVIAPDLIGHGESAKPRGDYSLGAHASGVRDVLLALGHDRATFVGHSLGGGVAMQLAYQFPELCERLVLVDSGGLGREVSLLLRAATLPGSEFVLPWLAATRMLDSARIVTGVLSRVGLRPATADLEEVAGAHHTLSDPAKRSAFIQTLRAVVDPGGQRISAASRLYLARHIPLLLLWGARDRIIPLAHGHETHAQVKGSRLEVFADSGHFPQLDEPERFAEALLGFIESTNPADLDAEGWRELLKTA
jgi:pimeloyl-ACP methyl ester carboxylesterase